jgi:hypothetical protein
MYGKIFSSMFRGSLHGQWEAIVTFVCMITLADKEGEIDMTAEALAAVTSIPLDIIKRGIASLESPDPQSRTPDEDGRRLVRASEARDWGWRITNYQHYRMMRSAEERREYFRQHKARRRAEIKAAATVDSPHVHPMSTVSTKAVSSKQYAVSSKQNKIYKADVDVGGRADGHPQDDGRVMAVLPSDYHDDYRRLRKAAQSPESLDRELVTLLAGKSPSAPQATPEDVGRGIRERLLSNRGPGTNGLANWVRIATKQRRDAETVAQPEVTIQSIRAKVGLDPATGKAVRR